MNNVKAYSRTMSGKSAADVSDLSTWPLLGAASSLAVQTVVRLAAAT